MRKKKIPLALKIFIALILGIIFGLAMQDNSDFVISYIKPFGSIYINLLNFIVVPIVLFSIMAGVISMEDLKKVGSIGIKTIVYYFCTTIFAVVIGLAGAFLFKGFFPVLETSDLQYNASEPVSFMDALVNMFPSNIIKPMSDAIMLQVIIMAIIIGFAIVLLGKKKAKPVVDIVNSLNEVFMKCMEIILKLSPIGVFCLISPVCAENGAAIIGSLAAVLAVAYLCFAAQLFVVYSIVVKTLGGISPLKFFKAQLPAMMFAFSSASSVATIPLNMKGCKKMGADEDVTSFVLPLGATINMDGTSIYLGVCVVFIATCYGITLDLPQLLTIVVTATLASIGTAGVPGAGLAMLTMVLGAVGLPAEGVALVAGIDRVFDMGRTTVNITGDASGVMVVSNLEKKKQFRQQKRLKKKESKEKYKNKN